MTTSAGDTSFQERLVFGQQHLSDRMEMDDINKKKKHYNI